ncbi:MAG TPA: hypothetical protein VGW38_06360 [Chloroflexota bacterium]|nr:hypothetical protein [Chloroflexota bacterium]
MRLLARLYRRAVPPLPHDVPVQTMRHVGRVEQSVWGVVSVYVLVMLMADALVVIFLPAPMATIVHALLLTATAIVATVTLLRVTRRRAVETARELETLRRAQEEAARLEGAVLAARTAAHRINNTLSPVAGYAELLTLNGAVTADPAAVLYAQQIMHAAHTAAEEIAHLQRLVRLQEDPMGHASGIPILDLDRSAAPAERN